METKTTSCLFNAQDVEVKKVPHRLSFSRKTIIMIPINSTKEDIGKIESKYRDEIGKLKHDSVSDYDIFGGQRS